MKEKNKKLEDTAHQYIVYENNVTNAASRLRWVDDFGKLERVCILKEYRGKSYGTDMINRMEKEVTKKGCTKTKLNAQTRAIDFYKRLGYKVVSGEFLDAGIPHVTMTKQLNHSL